MKRIIDYLKNMSTLVDLLTFTLAIRDNHFVIKDLKLDFSDDADKLSFRKYNEIKEMVDLIAEDTNSACSLELDCWGEFDVDTSYITSAVEDARSEMTLLKPVNLSGNDIAEPLENFYIDFAIEYGKLKITDLLIDDELKQYNDLVEDINDYVKLTSNKNDYIIKDIPEIKTSKELFNLLVKDFNILATTDYFDLFTKETTKKTISMYYKNDPVVKSRNRNMLNVFHQDYNLNWNAYKHDNEDIKDLYFTTIHTFEDLSWCISTCSKYWADYDGHNKLDGRGSRYVKETDNLGFDKMFADYFSDDVMKLLKRRAEFEIFFTNGEIETTYYNEDLYITVIGFDKNNNKVFALQVDQDYDTEIPKNLVYDLQVGVEKLLKDFYTLL